MELNNYCRLTDNRLLGYAEYGDPGGVPVFHFHGFPASRLEVKFMDGAATLLGIRLISPDRPGIGISPFKPYHDLLDWPADLIQLADRLKIDTFHVMGISGGGPFALACGYQFPDRIKQVGLVCGLGPMTTDDGFRRMTGLNRLGVELTGRFPGFMASFMAISIPVIKKYPDLLISGMSRSAPFSDQALLKEPIIRDMIHESFTETFRQGSQGPFQQLRLYTTPWGFELNKIKTRVRQWHGESDTIVPLSMAKQLAAQIPGCETTYFPDEGHFSLLANFAGRILASFTS